MKLMLGLGPGLRLELCQSSTASFRGEVYR